MLLIRVLIICSSSFLLDSKEIFDVQADDLIDTMLKNVYSGKFQQSNPIHKSTTQIPKYSTSKASTIKSFGATKHAALKKYADDMTVEEFNRRKRKLDLKVLLESYVSVIPSFDTKDDEIAAQTRRFNKVQESTKHENVLREIYFEYENGTFIYIEKNRTISLMAQFVYETRYKLPHAQLLRKKYISNTRYRMGYCFALLRMLKQQQMVIYSTMKNYLETMLTLYTHMKLYEKVIKLNVDIKDLMKYIEHLDKVRQMEATAKKSSTRKP